MTDLDAIKARVQVLQRHAGSTDYAARVIADCAALVAEVERLRDHRELCTDNLRKGYETGKSEERAAVVAWLRVWQGHMDDRITHDDADYAIRVIERGEHRREEEK